MERRYKSISMVAEYVDRQAETVAEHIEGDEDAEDALQDLYDYIYSLRDSRDAWHRQVEDWKDIAMTRVEDLGESGLRKILKETHGEPVKPLSAFCNAMSLWFKAIREKYRRETGQAPNPAKHDELIQGVDRWERPQFHGFHYAPYLGSIETDIRKSGLLARLMYGDEDELRTEMCPEHEGQMAMRVWMGVDKCDHGCDGTGWLPNDPNQ